MFSKTFGVSAAALLAIAGLVPSAYACDGDSACCAAPAQAAAASSAEAHCAMPSRLEAIAGSLNLTGLPQAAEVAARNAILAALESVKPIAADAAAKEDCCADAEAAVEVETAKSVSEEMACCLEEGAAAATANLHAAHSAAPAAAATPAGDLRTTDSARYIEAVAELIHALAEAGVTDADDIVKIVQTVTVAANENSVMTAQPAALMFATKPAAPAVETAAAATPDCCAEHEAVKTDD